MPKPVGPKEMDGRAQRRDRQIQVFKIQMEMAEAEKDRRGLWGMGKDQKATHEALRGGGKVGRQQDVLGMEHPNKGEVTGQADLTYETSFTIISRRHAHGAAQQEQQRYL